MKNTQPSRPVFSVFLIVAVCVVFSAGAFAKSKTPEAKFLFAQTAMEGGFDGKVLKLKNVSRTTLYFTDRPQRTAGHVTTSDFFKNWSQGADSFEKVPPNAVVSAVKDGKVTDAIVELKNPKPSGDVVTYEVKVIEGELPKNFEAVSLFIDDAKGTAMGSLYQTIGNSVAMAAANAVYAQQQANVTYQTSTTVAVQKLIGR